MRLRILMLVALVAVLASVRPVAASEQPAPGDIGLSLWFQDGIVRKQDLTPKTTTLIDGVRRFIQEIDITASVQTTTDQGIQPLLRQGDMADLNWRGITLVDEQWRPLNDGTTNLIRQRFYRNAIWMEELSAFLIVPLDSHGVAVGDVLFANGGADQVPLPTDDGFVRRYVARQVAFPCAKVGDCSAATTYIAEGLVQFRDALHPDVWARAIPKAATSLGLVWTAEPERIRVAPVTHVDRASVQWGYGFQPAIAVTNPPANGRFYVPGEDLLVQLSFFDGDGNRFFAPGSMPTYKDFETDNIPSGLRYYDGFRQVLELYYAQKHREGNMLVDVAGPVDQLHYPANTQPTSADLFLPQTVFADADADGFTSIAALQPPAGSEVPPGDVNPVSDTIDFVIPTNAKPGTYLITVKARRDYGGEALNRVGEAEIQVGQAKVSPPTRFTTGNCENCHQDRTDFGVILHGVDDRRRCFGCHPQLGFEPNHALDCRVHTIHTRSRRVSANVNDCRLCHLQQPTGIPRCFPGYDILP